MGKGQSPGREDTASFISWQEHSSGHKQFQGMESCKARLPRLNNTGNAKCSWLTVCLRGTTWAKRRCQDFKYLGRLQKGLQALSGWGTETVVGSF